MGICCEAIRTFLFPEPLCEGGELPRMAKILVQPREAVKDALRRFKKLCDREGVVNRSKRVARFEKPSVRRRRKKNERLKNIRKAQRAMD